MAAKNRPKHPRSHSRAPSLVSISDILGLHVQGSQRRDELLQQARDLQAQGKIKEARAALSRAETIQTHLDALAKSVHPKVPKHLQ